MKHFGLIGRVLTHSFSKKYFDEKFTTLGNECYDYGLYELQSVGEVPDLIASCHLSGFNVTIPYKQAIIPYLDELSDEARRVGAVNVVKVDYGSTGKPYLIGYNSDVYGFEHSLRPLLKPNHSHALILGTGGASKAVAYVLENLNICYKLVSRQKAGDNILSYDDVDSILLSTHHLVVNATPLGMYPCIDRCPHIDYRGLTSDHLCYDLVYNPATTLFLSRSYARGASIKNGMDMLLLQAEKSWKIWTND